MIILVEKMGLLGLGYKTMQVENMYENIDVDERTWQEFIIAKLSIIQIH
jgi:hypothetical protein